VDVAGHEVSLSGLLVLGTSVGFVAGMFGVGGGFLLTPLLSVVFGIPLPIAIGTALCQMVGTALVALLRHRKLGQGELRFDVTMFAGSMVGVAAGSRAVSALERAGSLELFSGRIPIVTLVLYSAYCAMLGGTSWLFWKQGGSDAPRQPEKGPLARIAWGPSITLPAVSMQGVSVLVIAYLGLAMGFLSGLLGIGAGVALMPVLIYGFGFPIRQAAGTGVLALVLTSAAGTAHHALADHVDLRLACVLLVGSTVSAQVGALLTRRLPARALRRIFAGLLWLTIVAIVFDVFRRLS
jgi:hypothetical protein